MKKILALAVLTALVLVCAPLTAFAGGSAPLPDPTSAFYTTYENSLATLADFDQISYNAASRNASVLRFGPVSVILCYKGAYQTMVFVPSWRVRYQWDEGAEWETVRFEKKSGGPTFAYITARPRKGFFASATCLFTNFIDPAEDSLAPANR